MENESKIDRYELVSGIEYDKYKINVVRYTETKDESSTEFTYATNLSVKDSNIVDTVNLGRKRWKIENEGFNMQKNGTFDIGHLYSKNQNSIKVHYLLIQMAHLLRQLLEKGDVKVKKLKLKIKEISKKLKKSLISKPINLVEYSKMQLRFHD